jgi:tetratricopeptide (TPR) repeat protein
MGYIVISLNKHRFWPDPEKRRLPMKQYISSLICGTIILITLIPGALGQQGGQTTGNSGNTGTSGGTTTSPKVEPPPIIVSPPSLQLPPREIQPLFISGMVMREDGSLPPFGSIIEMDCGEAKTREALVNPNGRFTFQYGGARKFGDIVPDASDATGHINDEDAIYWSPTRSGNASRIETTTPLYIRLSGCDLRVQVPGYRSSVLRLNGATLTTVNEVGTIVVYPIERVRGTVVSAASLFAPKTARNLLQRAEKAFRKEKLKECEALLQDAVREHPRYGEAWLLLGQLYQRQQQYEKAQDALKKAIATDSMYVPPLIQLGWLFSLEQKWQESADITEQVLALDPVNFSDAYYLNALANYNLKNYEVALKRVEQSIGRDTSHQYPRAHLILANIYSLKKDPLSARSEMKKYVKYAPNAPDAALVRAHLEKPVDMTATVQ